MHNPFAENKKLFFLIVKIFEYILIITSENKDKVFHVRWQFPLPIHFKMSAKEIEPTDTPVNRRFTSIITGFRFHTDMLLSLLLFIFEQYNNKYKMP